MFSSTPFYFSTIRKYIILFGTLFNGIYITRTNSAGNTTFIERVPITYGPKDKMLTRVVQDPNIDRPTATYPLPMMAFEMTGFNYDGTRKLQTINRVAAVDPDNKDKNKYQYMPVPYNIGFRLSVLVKNAEDGNKIVEQILPYFTPDWTTSIHLIPELDIRMDIPVILNTVNLDDVYEGDFKERRSMVWTLDFTLKGYLYGPVKTQKVVKFTNTEFFTANSTTFGQIFSSNTGFYIANTTQISDAVNSVPVAAYIQIQPGLTANGQPTSNSAASIPVTDIVATDDFGYVTAITERDYGTQ
jgi:hypothetical protein